MRINSEADYFKFLQALIELREQFAKSYAEGGDKIQSLPDGTSYDDAYDKLESAVCGYLRGLTSEQGRKLADRSPSAEIKAAHEERLKLVEELYVKRMAGGYLFDTRKNVGLVAARLMLFEKGKAEHKQRIKAEGRIVTCANCTSVFHSGETSRVKLPGHSRYVRLCKSCAEKAAQAKAISKILKRT